MRLAATLFFAIMLVSVPLAAGAQVRTTVNPDTTLPFTSDPAAAIKTARERVAAGKLQDAIIGLQSYMANHPGENGPERLLGDLYFREGDIARSEATYRHILSYYPNDKETHNRLGSVFATENRVDDAINEFNRSLPGTDAVPDLVRLHMRRGDLEAYRHQLERVAQAYPTSADAQIEMGQLYETVGQPEVAERFFKRALDDQPDSIMARNGLGLSYMDEHRYSEAIQTFTSCLGLDAFNYGCKDNLGATYLHMSKWEPARVLLLQAHAMQPERSEALINLGYLSDELGNWKKAVAYYIEATTVYPYDADAYVNLGSTYTEHHLYPLAQAALIKGLAVAPDDGRLHLLLGDVYNRQGNSALAAAQYRAAAVSQNLDETYKQAAKQRMMAIQRPRPSATP